MNEKATILTRRQVPEAAQWDLTKIFAAEAEWEAALAEVKVRAANLARRKGQICSSAGALVTFLNSYMDLQILLGKVRNYANLDADTDTSDSAKQARLGRYKQLEVAVDTQLSFVTTELSALSEAQLEAYLQADENLNFYHHYMLDLIRKAKHNLSPKEEKLLAAMQIFTGAAADIFKTLNNADLRFNNIQNKDGEELPLTHANHVSIMGGEDRVLRANASKALYEQYEQYSHVFAATLYKQVQAHNFAANLRGFDSARQAALFYPNIPEAIYDNLLQTVNDNLDLQHEYVRYKRENLGLEDLHSYDLSAPLGKGGDFHLSFKEAADLLIEALAPLGEDYLAILRQAFAERWIDWQPNLGKRSGAYSGGTYGTPPYILMSYDGSISNLYTLAHELGHSVHSYLSRKHQRPPYSSYPIFLAEIASTTNEQLLTNYLLSRDLDKESKKFLIDSHLNKARTKIFRQTQFAEFEYLIHKAEQEGQTLTADYLSAVYGAVNQKYYGPQLLFSRAAACEWARIPHFYYNFYVYQYATGFSAACAFSKAISSGDVAARERYLTFLSAGSSAYPLEVLQAAGVDMLNPEPIIAALEEFKHYLDLAEAL